MSGQPETRSFAPLPLYVGHTTVVIRRQDDAAPHRHPHHELYVALGEGVLEVDGTSRPIVGPVAILVGAGRLHRWTAPSNIDLWVVGLTAAATTQRLATDSAMTNVAILESASNVDIPGRETQDVLALLRLAKRRFEESPKGPDLTATHLQALIAQLAAWSTASNRQVRPNNPGDQLITKFLADLSRRAGRRRPVSDYASDLGISAGHLSTIVKDQLGQTPTELIDSHTLAEARRLLLFSEATSSSISGQLGFADPSQFGRWFRRQTSTTPTRFRNDPNHNEP